ncbi:hypothetical protein SAMN05216421_0929 [Halopseudomonas xinjiangensis]|uniref:Ion channel n=1 Tax=Halopseudomonas xinjiangensis TaxID=487184 RepID=A0A1H1PJM0_9GAMM|nr:hypothetical protein [Halopseudomonas xinjiangensis]SDS11287.1 hypothetical protein SAMN05216421_0929 [Halopseudomonas xinjiangensis]
MAIVLTLLAVVLAAVILWDQFVTVFSTSGAGPLTRFGMRHVWHSLLFVHRRRRMHRVLAFAGPFLLLLSIVLWYLLFGFAVFLAFAAHTGSVIDSTTDVPANNIETLYFVNTTISSLGYGDWVPSGFPWTFVGTLATLAATIVLTVSLSYVLSVISAAIQRRALASGIFAMGSSVSEVIEHLRLDDPEASLKNYLLSLSSTIDSVALQHLAYPVLKYFHSARVDLSPARAVLLLSDTLFVMSVSDSKMPAGVVSVVRSSIDNFAKYSRAETGSAQTASSFPGFLKQLSIDRGIPADVVAAEFEAYSKVRAGLVALTSEDGWLEEAPARLD